jgi:hypothetical protein
MNETISKNIPNMYIYFNISVEKLFDFEKKKKMIL